MTFDVEEVDVCDASMTSTQKHIVVAHNRNLIEYFARLAQSTDDTESINLEYVETVLKNGADIDCTDKYGQTIFHEVSSEVETTSSRVLRLIMRFPRYSLKDLRILQSNFASQLPL